MGIIIKPVCTCNTKFPSIKIGGGFNDIGEKCSLPTPCFNCKTIFTRNLFSKVLRCPKCKKEVNHYGEITDFDKMGNEILNWNLDSKIKYQLLSRNYVCPVCNKEELSFIKEMMWD